jgi:hypothetical protein
MKIEKFTYRKPTGESKSYELLVIKKDASYLEGVSLKELTPVQKEEVIKIYKEFEDKLTPFMSQYRRFNMNSIIKMEE